MNTAFTLLASHPPASVQAGREFQFGTVRHQGALLVSPGGIYDWRGAAAQAGFDGQGLLAFLDAEASLRCDFLLLGTGARRAFPLSLEPEIARRGLGFEAMDTAAACRTYNVLAAENRRFLAALLPL